MAVVCGDIVGPLMAPAAYGFLTAFHGFGQAAGPYVAGRLADSLPTFTASYLMAAGVAFLGAMVLLLLRGGTREGGRNLRHAGLRDGDRRRRTAPLEKRARGSTGDGDPSAAPCILERRCHHSPSRTSWPN